MRVRTNSIRPYCWPALFLMVLLRCAPSLMGQAQNSAISSPPLAAAQNVQTAKAPRPKPNYDERLIHKYTLPDPLRMLNGQRVTSADMWYQFRRPELLNLFETYVYGRTPTYKPEMKCHQFESSDNALGGTALRRQVTCYFNGKITGPQMDILIYLPVAAARNPVPLFLGLNFTGNQSVNADPAIKLGEVWNRETKIRHPAPESSRGTWAREWQVEKVVGHGYGIASIYYGDIDPDFPGGLAAGIRPLFFSPYQVGPEPDDWGSIGAWSYGLSRALDYLQTMKEVDGKRVMLVGQSRLGKTVLWAGAQDTRFALVIANCSGRSGASLARRNYGETVASMVIAFPHQFAINYQRFGQNHVDELPVDTHELLALIAPRPLFLGTATLDNWSDPKGEFLAAKAAEPAFRLLGVQGLSAAKFPPPDKPVMSRLGFLYRTGEHQITAYDWDVFLQFADKYLPPHR